MRLFILIGILLVSVLVSGKAQTVRIVKEEQSIRLLFDEVERQTGIYTLFSNNELDMNKRVKLELRDYTLEELYRRILKGTNLEFRILRDYVVIRVVGCDKQKLQHEVNAVRGKVLDENGEILAGVTIVVKGSDYGVTTDDNGIFDILLPTGKSVVLCFSFVGKRDREVACSGGSYLDVVLEDESQRVGEVVITGYQNISKRHLTSAVTSMNVNDVMMPGVSSIDRMLEGHIPGMIFMQNSGQVGVSPRLRVRGTSSVLGTREPLWVIDGIVQYDPVNVDPAQINDLDFVNLLGNAISSLNPDDVERIDVLKDASATALYGVRAANGVIVITTKKGREGPLSVNYNFTGSLIRRSRYVNREVNMMNAAERIDYSREMIEKGLVYPRVSSWVGYESVLKDYYDGRLSFEEFQDRVNFYETNNTDWFDVLCRDAFSFNHHFSFSGGTSSVKYYASLGYNRENGVLKKEYGDRYTARVQMMLNYKRLNMSIGMSGNRQGKHYTPTEVGLLNYAYNTSRAVPVFNEDGSLWYYPKQGSRYIVNYNVLNERDHSKQTIKSSGVSLVANLNYRLINGLRAEAVVAYDLSDTDQEVVFGEKTAYAADLRGELYDGTRIQETHSYLPFGKELREESTKSTSYTLRGQLNYNHCLDRDENHLFSLLVGGEIVSVKYTGKKQIDRGQKTVALFGGNYPNFEEWLRNTPEALGVYKHQITNIVSWYGSLTYSIQNTYILNMNIRIDASNKFGKEANHKLLPIWSVSGRWNMRDDLFQRLTYVDDFSFRVSFGFQGNMLDLETPEMVIEYGGWDHIMEANKASVYKFPNPNLAWEKTASFNLGVDFSFFKRRLYGTYSYFHKKTQDAFLKKKISVINGVREYIVNQGTIVNQGFELVLSGYIFAPSGEKKSDFSWRIDSQIGQVVNKLEDEEKNQVLHDAYTYQDYLEGNVQIVGRPLNSFFSYEFTGLDSRDGRPTFARVGEENWEKYAEMSKNDVFQTVMNFSGSRVPYIQGAVGSNLCYKNFELSCNFTYSLGSKVRLLRLYNNVTDILPQPTENLRRELLDRWRRPGDEYFTNIPGLLTNSAFEETMNNSWWKGEAFKFAENIWQMYNDSDIRVVSGNYLKLQQLKLCYMIPENWCKRNKLKAIRLSLTALHLFTWGHKALRGQDPNTQTGSTSNINVPLCPSYSFGLSVSY
ncbi:SusC/RagA family TonB-linked outer membrane protein [Butyricimonas paravirosa]